MISRPLQGCAVGISVSESESSSTRGFPLWQVNRLTLQTASALLGQGAGLVFGHDWRADGVMDAIYRFALQFEQPAPGEKESRALMQNLLPWPDKPKLSKDEQDRLGSILLIEKAGLPPELAARQAEVKPGSETFKYFRARALTHMRRRLNDRIVARVSFGGRTSGSQGRYPGVTEEILLAMQQQRPLYLAGLLAGATSQVIDAIEGKEMPEKFCEGSSVMRELYGAHAMLEGSEQNQPDREVDPATLWAGFAKFGIASLSKLNFLDENENRTLFHTLDFEQAIGLILSGIGRALRK